MGNFHQLFITALATSKKEEHFSFLFFQMGIAEKYSRKTQEIICNLHL